MIYFNDNRQIDDDHLDDGQDDDGHVDDDQQDDDDHVDDQQDDDDYDNEVRAVAANSPSRASPPRSLLQTSP